MTQPMSVPITLKAQIIGTEEVVGRLNGYPGKAFAALSDVVKRLAYHMQARIKMERLSLPYPGPSGLAVQSGNLRSSINVRFDEHPPAKISAYVGTVVTYGRFWELGWSGVQNVSPFVRNITQRNVVKLYPSGAKRKLASGVAFVRAHARHVNAEPRPFLQPVFESMRPQIRKEIMDAIANVKI